MKEPDDSSPSSTPGKIRWWELLVEKIRRYPLRAGIAVLVLLLLFFALKPSGSSDTTGITVGKAVRGDLEIVVLDGGNIRAVESLELKSQVEGREGAKILSIVEEGYEVTTEDVESEKVLVKLDPTEVKEKIEAHDIEFENAQSFLTEMDEGRAIQATESQNEIKEARQAARFALLDLEKYLGKSASVEVLALRSLPSDEASLLAYEEGFRARLIAGGATPGPGESGDGGSEPELEEGGGEEERDVPNEEIIDRGEWVQVDFASYLEGERLGDGEAKQELRKKQDELLVAQTEFAVESEKVEGSERLAAQNFIAKSTLETEKVTLEKARIKVLSGKTQLELFLAYEFPKKAEEFLTKYEDALHKLDREKREALAKLSQAEAKFRSAEQKFKLAIKKRDELNTQLESCTIKATKPGLVVYGSNDRNRYYGRQDKIEEGASVRYKQTIITIPDMTLMGVKVSVHESHIKKIKSGQDVRITTDAEPDKILSGTVKKVAVLADSNSWWGSQQKVYPTEIEIEGTHEWLKPGMSAKVEIVTGTLEDVLYVPLQSVVVESGETWCYLKKGSRHERRAVKTGGFNDEFIEIKEGLAEGDPVFLSKPEGAGGDSGEVEEADA